jgi:hypothetical protein
MKEHRKHHRDDVDGFENIIGEGAEIAQGMAKKSAIKCHQCGSKLGSNHYGCTECATHHMTSY